MQLRFICRCYLSASYHCYWNQYHMSNLICPIDHHSLLLVRGADARKFLQGQVTCDIDALTLESTGNNTIATTTLGAHCTHKGRMVFNFRAMPLDEQTIALNIPSDMMDIATAALQKYIVFSKAELINASDDYELIGIEGDDAIATLQSLLGALPEHDNSAIHHSDGIALRLSKNRYELWLSTDQAKTINNHFESLETSNNNFWDFATITAGIAEIRPTTSEMFTPQAVNLQAVGDGVSFKKGCYTGQEVVARMHYLGKAKRQMFLFELPENITELPNIGDPLFSPEKSQSIGDIILAAKYNERACLLASVTVDQAEQDAVYIDSQYQQKLHRLALPYAIPKE